MAADIKCPFYPTSVKKLALLVMELHQLKQIEDHVSSNGSTNCPHPSLKDVIFGGLLAGTSPLLLACHHGQLDSVKHLIENWGVDVCASAKYYSPNRIMCRGRTSFQSATPIFVAAYCGYDHIVRYLLEKGADVSVQTINRTNLNFNGLTPLYGAVSLRVFPESSRTPSTAEVCERRSAIVRSLLEFGANPSIRPSSRRPIWMQELCEADMITALISHGLDLKQRYLYSGETILNYVTALPRGFTEEESLAIVRLLVETGADLSARNIQGFTAILRAANCDRRLCNFAILDYLLELDGIGRMEKIDALELAGARILSEDGNSPLFPKAFEYWRRAHHLREIEKEATGSSAEKLLGPKKGGIIEWTTLSQLEHVIQHPEEYKIQSLHVILRVLSGRSWEAVEMDVSTCYYMMASSGNLHTTTFVKRIEFELAALNAICRFNPREEIKGLHFELRKRTVSVVNNFIDMLLVETSSVLSSGHPYATLLPFKWYETSFDLILLALNHLKPDKFHEILFQRLFHLLAVLFRLPGMLSEETHRNSMIQLLRERVGSYRLGFILLLACEHTWNLRYLATIRLFIEAGADPNVGLDRTGNASLHLVARLYDQELCEAAASLLVESGAHMDRVNKAGQTAEDVWIETRFENGADTGWSARPEWCRTVPNLLCIAARFVRVHKIPYKSTTPATLHSIVSMH